ncbi:MAG: putative toxin-antitoxin system toxin component, PIN family [Planctomycetaceae bacterium]
MRVVLDTNVLVRALCAPQGPARELLQLIATTPNDLILSPFVLGELHRVMRYDRLRALHQRDDDWISARISELESMAIIISMGEGAPTNVVASDPDDDPIVALAVAGQAECIATLDRHLRTSAVQEYCRKFGIEVCSDLELLERLRGLTQP